MKSGSRIPWSPKLEDNPVVVRTGIVVHMDQTKIPIRKLFQDLANDLVIVIDLDPAAVGADNQVLELFFFIRDGRRGELVDPGALIVSWEMDSAPLVFQPDVPNGTTPCQGQSASVSLRIPSWIVKLSHNRTG